MMARLTSRTLPIEKTFWEARKRGNLLFVHYDDLQADLVGEMRRIADFLDIDVSDAELSGMAGSASFQSMRKDAAVLIPEMAKNSKAAPCGW